MSGPVTLPELTRWFKKAARDRLYVPAEEGPGWFTNGIIAIHTDAMSDPTGARHLALAAGAEAKAIDMARIVPALDATRPARLSPVQYQPIDRTSPLRLLLSDEGEPVMADFALWAWLGKDNAPDGWRWAWHVQTPTSPMIATQGQGEDCPPLLVMMPCAPSPRCAESVAEVYKRLMTEEAQS